MKNRDEIINTIKLLLYKENTSVFKKLNFDDDEVFLEPLLFAYFNSKSYNSYPKEALEEMLQGYFIKKEEIITHSYSRDGIAYVPNIGYFKVNESIPFEKIKFIAHTNIELIQYPIIYLKYIFRDFNEQPIEERKITISKELVEVHEESLTIALSYIKKYSSNHYNLIEQCCKKILLFKTDPKNTNPFATINAHGIAFLNVFQKEYDEVFFVDDIAHQTGHCIFYALLEDTSEFIKVEPSITIEIISYGQNETENRSLYILFHALYTYYTTLKCLDACLSEGVFSGAKKHEAIGRLCFYFSKCYKDILLIDNPISSNTRAKEMFTDKGFKVYSEIKRTFIDLADKWRKDIEKGYSLSNQPYNFSYSKFVKLNPLNENNR